MKTTRIDTMKKSVNGKSGKELLDLCAKYFNELANGYFFEYEEVRWDNENNCYRESEDNNRIYSSVDSFCGEISYWLSCYYEGGNTRHEDEYNDRKSFIKFLQVFVPFCSDKPVNLGFTRWIPLKDETRFLF